MTCENRATAKEDQSAREPVFGLCSFAQLSGCRFAAADGIAGVLDDLYFDDDAWVVRFVVVKLEDDVDGRCVLLFTAAIARRGLDSRMLAVSLTRAEVADCPKIDTQKPVYRQHVLASLDHYSGLGYAESAAEFTNERVAESAAVLNAPTRPPGDDDPHLRSANEVLGYQIHASDGNLGQLQGLLIDEKSWVIRYVIASTSDWWHGREVLIEPARVERVEWSNARVSVKLTRQTVKQLPRYEPH